MTETDRRQYRCHSCGQLHAGPPLSYAVEAPDRWYSLSEEDRQIHAVLSSDQCIINNAYFYIVGNIDIPLIDAEGVFSWSVWLSLSKADFQQTSKLWKKRRREAAPPYPGRLSTQLFVYPDTLNLKTRVHTRPVGQRPYVEIESIDHPLAVEQRQGITLERVQFFAERILHDQQSG